MTARQICNYVYALRALNAANGEKPEEEMEKFDTWLYSPLDPGQAAAADAFIRDLRGGL